MCQTLFTIPHEVGGISVFGIGWVFGLWALVALALLGRSLMRHGMGSETIGLWPLAVVGVLIAVVLPRIMEPAGLPVRGYGVMLLLSVVAGVGLSYYRAVRFGWDPELILSLAVWFFICGLLGARFFYIVEYWHQFQKASWGETFTAIINLTQGGLVVYGSLLAGGAALVVFVYKHHLSGLAFTDLIAPGVVLGVGLGRLGCFLNGCCYGGLSDVPWAVQFPANTPAYMDQVQQHQLFVHGLIFKGAPNDPPVIAEVEPGSAAAAQGLQPGQRVTGINKQMVQTVEEAEWSLLRTYGAGTEVVIHLAGDPEPKRWTLTAMEPRSRPVHPAQLYSLIDALLLCGFLLAFEPYKRWEGELTALVLTIHPISRFLLEIIRVDESAVFNTGLSISQNISIAIFAGGVALWIYLFWRGPRAGAWTGPRLAVSN